MYQEQNSKIDNSSEENSNDLIKPEDVKLGVVAGCKRLNIRKGPQADAKIVCEIDNQTEVVINEAESTDSFYKVCTTTGIEGFCMKKFITVRS